MPRHPANPVGQVRRIKKSTQRLRRHLRDVRDWLFQEIRNIPVQRIEVNALHINESYYEFQIDTVTLDLLVQDLVRRLGVDINDKLIREVLAAYEEGTAAAATNLAGLTSDYTREITAILISVPYQRRVALVSSRVFEEMEGFAGQTGRDLARVLRTGIENGQNPRDLIDTLQERFKVSASRAERIARTEITQAYRRARMDEAQDANERLGIRVRLMHLSALSPTTRAHHAARHRKVYTIQEVREWYARDANAINCKCVTVEILVDEEGRPMNRNIATNSVLIAA